MKVLAVETATVAGSIALAGTEEGLIGEVRVDVTTAHSERLMPSVAWLLRASLTAVEEIDAFAVSIGPGSFTGLRIGLSTVKGLAYATGRPVVPVRTLDALARTLPFSSCMICPMLDARKNEVYAALYQWDRGRCEKLMAERAVSPSALLEELTGPTVFIGNGVQMYEDIILARMGENALFPPMSHRSPSASAVAAMALENIDSVDRIDPVALSPYYIRKSEAEIHWKGS